MTEPSAKLLADERIPCFTIDGVRWPVPKLAPRQNEFVVPLIMRWLPRMAKETAVLDLTSESLRELGTIAFYALQRGHESLTREEFDNMPIGVQDLIAFFPIVADQSGCFRMSKQGENVPPGEARASHPTGTG